MAALTGLRRGELKRLLWADVHLDVPKPWIDVRAATTKNKLPAAIFLVPLLVQLLRAHRGPGVGLVLADGVPSVTTLTKDLKACKIPVHDDRGWRVDFHSLRHTYANLLNAAEVSDGVRVKMVRHAELRQTDRYGPQQRGASCRHAETRPALTFLTGIPKSREFVSNGWKACPKRKSG